MNLPKSKEAIAKLKSERIKDFYYYCPELLFKKYVPQFKWPRVIEDIFKNLYGNGIKRAIMKGPRGGGKSQLISALAFSLWFFKERKVLDLGGAHAQAKIVYNYILEYLHGNEAILNTLEKPPMMQHTIDRKGNYMKCIPASQKQVRGPHPDVLLGDEVVECKDELIEAALPMVDASDNPLIVLTSTFHKVFGIFQDIWDNANEYGYTRFSWDVFDIAQEFDPKIWEDERLNKEISDLGKLKEISQGKTGDPEGWVSINNIIQAWREKPTLEYFLVEYMGNRPSQSGLVSNPEDVDACIFDDKQIIKYNYKQGAFCSLGIDWGFSSMTALVDLMKYKDDIKSMVDCQLYTQVPLSVIIEDVIKICEVRPRQFIYADSAGKFENEELQNALRKAYRNGRIKMNTTVVEVVFSQEKDELLGCYRSNWEKRLFRVPKKYRTAIWQYKRYRYQEGLDKPVKEDDHIPDATLCALKPFNAPVPGHLSDLGEQKKSGITGGLLGKEF